MNKYDLFDALGGVDEDLLERSERKAHKRLSLRKPLIAAAAVMMMVVTVLAAPAIQNWFFASESELYLEGAIYEPDENGFGGGFSGATYYVEMVMEDAADLPLFIEDFRMPTYFKEHGWNITPTYLEKYRDSSSTCFFFQPADDDSIGVLFMQETFSASSAWDETREITFGVSGTVDGELEKQPITIGDLEATLYITPPWSAEGVGSDPGQKEVIWTDGEYGYSIEFDYGAELSFIEEVILSLDSVDISTYEPVAPDEAARVKPIETFYSLGTVPDGFKLTIRSWDVNNASEWYMLDEDHFIELAQCVKLGFDNDGPGFSIEDTLDHLKRERREFTTAEYTLDELEVTVIRTADSGPSVMWYRDEYCFNLYFTNDIGLSDQELLEYVRSVQPMPDYTDHLTD